MNEKILALCSGGFDSIVLVNSLRGSQPDCDLNLLFFDFGQRNVESELKCTQKVAGKVNGNLYCITLPKFSWSSGEFYAENFNADKEYLEMRNLIFLSYAISFAESKGIKKVYLATLKSLGYYDTSETFLRKIGSIASDKGIEIIAPFSDCTKYDLAPLAFHYDIGISDFFTCNHPIGGKPCGKCPDCLIVKDIMKSIEIDSPVKHWVKNLNPHSTEFQSLFKESKITEMRVLINNDCQLHCKHCYYGFTEMLKPRLTLNEFSKVFEQSTTLGINEYHFSGKEPLYDDFFIKVADCIKKVNPQANLTMVTNGINVPKYALDLKNHGFTKIFLSVDDLCNSSMVRSVHHVTDKAIKALKNVGIEIEIFVDVHKNNFDKISEILDCLHSSYGVDTIWVKVISDIGSAQNIDLINCDEVLIAYNEALEYARANEKANIIFTLPAPYTYDYLGENKDDTITQGIKCVMGEANSSILQNFNFYPEFYCSSYENQITLTPDGYLMGCASQCSVCKYDKISVGNVRNAPLSYLIQQGKSQTINFNENEVDEEGNICFYSCTSKRFSEKFLETP